MRFIDMFCGIGGFRLGLKKASKQYQCVWANDNDPRACQIYWRRFKDDKLDWRDIREIPSPDVPDHDLLCGGFPCQSFSIMGKRRGYEDTRGTLFFEICRILRDKRPRYLFLENVEGLLSHDRGSTFQTILKSLDELGYDCQWQVLNGGYWLPQDRERVFIIGYIRGEPQPEVFPLPKSTYLRPREDEKRLWSSCLTGGNIRAGSGSSTVIWRRYGQVGNNESHQVKKQQDGIRVPPSAISGGLPIQETLGGVQDRYSLPEEKSSDFSRQLLLAFMPNTREDSKKQQGILEDKTQEEQGAGLSSQGTTRTRRVDSLSLMGVPVKELQPKEFRILTITEWERLQGFPDGWTEGIPETERFICIGNAVMVKIIEVIGRRLLEVLNNQRCITPPAGEAL